MSTMNQLRHGLSKAWGNLTEDWRELKERASDSLTRFQPKKNEGEAETNDDKIIAKASRWGILAAEVTDSGNALNVSLEAPGLDSADIDIEVIDNVLVVRGEKKLAREEQRGHYHIMERAYGHFERAIRLPEAVDDGRAKAKYKSGVLTVTLPKAKATKSKRILVE